MNKSEKFFQELPDEFTPRLGYQIGKEKFSISERTVHNYCNKLIQKGKLSKVGPNYKKPKIAAGAVAANLPSLGWGFLDTAEEYIHQGLQVSMGFQAKVRNLVNCIASGEKWMKHIREKAQNLKLTVDRVIRMYAEWMIQQ